MNQYTPLSVYLPLRLKLILLGAAGVCVILAAVLGLAALIDWIIWMARK